jgi:hypothetical protein
LGFGQEAGVVDENGASGSCRSVGDDVEAAEDLQRVRSRALLEGDDLDVRLIPRRRSAARSLGQPTSPVEKGPGAGGSIVHDVEIHEADLPTPAAASERQRRAGPPVPIARTRAALSFFCPSMPTSGMRGGAVAADLFGRESQFEADGAGGGSPSLRHHRGAAGDRGMIERVASEGGIALLE